VRPVLLYLSFRCKDSSLICLGHRALASRTLLEYSDMVLRKSRWETWLASGACFGPFRSPPEG